MPSISDLSHSSPYQCQPASMPRNIRRESLKRLATICASNPTASHHDIARLSTRCPGPRTNSASSSRPIAITLPELEALIALCKAASSAVTIEAAAQLLPQISAYLPRCHDQTLNIPLSLPDDFSSPWESLAFHLSSAVLSLGLSHPSLRQHASSTTARYVSAWLEASRSCINMQLDTEDEEDETTVMAIERIIRLAMSLLGFLEAAASHASFWTPHERLHVVRILRDALSERYMITLETALSMVRNTRHFDGDLGRWKHYTKIYAVAGRPLGAMLLRSGFMQLVKAFASLEVVTPEILTSEEVLEFLLANRLPELLDQPSSDILVEQLAEIAADELQLLEEGSDYLQLGSSWQRRLASAVKADAFTCLLCCALVDEDITEPDGLLTSLEATMSDPNQIVDDYLAAAVFKSIAILARTSPTIGSTITRSLTKIISQGRLDSKTTSVVADCLASVLKMLPQDATITTLYSLGNALSMSSKPQDKSMVTPPTYDASEKPHRNGVFQGENGGSVVSFAPSITEEPSLVYATTIEAVVRIAVACKEDKIIALALSMLSQKIGRLSPEVDAKIVIETATLGVHSAVSELRSMLKVYTKLCHDGLVHGNATMLDAVMRARVTLSQGIKRGSPLFEIYILHLLETIVSKGDAHESRSKPFGDVELAAREIAQLLRPLAILAASNASPNAEEDLGIEGFAVQQRNAWFNAAVHGFTLTSPYGMRYRQELQTLAQYSMPLIAENRTDQLESDIELNTTLRRGKGSDQAAVYRKHLLEALPKSEQHIRSLSYSELVFLTSAHMVENLRAMSGDCTRVLTYFLDPRLRDDDLGFCMIDVAYSTVSTYLARTRAGVQNFTAPYVAQQLALFFAGCCHRIGKVQDVAIKCADHIITQVPSALCHKSSIYALFELLSIMWISNLEKDTEEYEWKPKYTSERGGVSVELSDDYQFRHQTLMNLHKYAKKWVTQVLDIAPLDIKGLIQTYLSEFDDQGSYDHVSLGRSFALEMGGLIPSTDQRLSAVSRENDMPINTASDFIVQYTTRQEYRYIDGLQDGTESIANLDKSSSAAKAQRIEKSMNDARILLDDIESRTARHENVSVEEIRDVLRRAGALLCRIDTDEGAIVHHLVGIPFAVLSKQAIKLGISLWMGVIKENPRTESRILAEVAECWEDTIRKRRGLFDRRLHVLDPFFVKQEFAPSDRALISRRQKFALDLIAPHLRLLQFLSSHFHATRLGTMHIQRIYQRVIKKTLNALARGINHPLTREACLHVVLLGAKILRVSTNFKASVLWRFKDRLLSAALAWFSTSPKWSYGGNRLQLRAESTLLSDVAVALEKVNHIGIESVKSRKSLTPKYELLVLLLSNEQTRLNVWLDPLEPDKRIGHVVHSAATEQRLIVALRTAWDEKPAIAIELERRFHSPVLNSKLRFFLLSWPQKVLKNCDAVEMILGSTIAPDISHQLRYLLYWDCVNPITAVSYFLPAYQSDPLVIQYAMRALESHSVDTTFFYVPQIVQTLRYDSLGYVERYIIETAKFSQLFAHQIIWNMKANAYKDDESTIPDPVKPILDRVMTRLINSFSPEDKDFYEREFNFFNEVTDISGKLKPLIKKSKPEKKLKIEEELRKIKVAHGVYLPSNPDGVVIGIDRKSGKPLQSHAKAPYMATFRIRKQIAEVPELEEEDLIMSNGHTAEPNTYEVWQSAIFKVGDDCRQDLLALQLVAAFRGIFHSVGLDVYVFPYRVTATAPGCGVIDVLPNSISRDMLGREAVNGLHDYFKSKYGGEDSIRYQEARNNFVKSMAAYSVISYLLQFKDRHNGNIMIDDQGHILHIDFGFCFDIVPGGVKFERAPFKLTQEMVAVMGGLNSQSYKWFEELCIKSFLACRQYAEHLVHMVIVMIDSGLPCFKPNTIKHLRERFVLNKNEKEASEFMRSLIQKSCDSLATKGYDQFQLWTNGIPY